jgi:hypothetical protein
MNAHLRFVPMLVLAGCFGGGRAYVAPQPSVTEGVTVKVDKATVKGNNVLLNMSVVNDSAYELQINRNQLALVVPDGREFYRTAGSELHHLRPGARMPLNVGVDVDPGSLRKAPGFWVRLDGFYVGNVRLDLTPLALGEPTGSAGTTNPGFTATTPEDVAKSRPKRGGFREMVDRVLDGTALADKPAGTSSAAASTDPAPAKTDTMQQYKGPRRQIKVKGTKCAAMPFKTKQVAEQMAFIMDELLLTELQSSGFEAIGPDDINAMIGFEKTKEAAGCDDVSCVTEIGNALGVEFLVAGNAATLDGSVVLTMKLLDVRKARVLSRTNKVAEGGPKNLPRLIAEAVQELVDRSAL